MRTGQPSNRAGSRGRGRRSGLLLAVVLAGACTAGATDEPASHAPSALPSASSGPSASAPALSALPTLKDGLVAAGRYVIAPGPLGWMDCEADPSQTEPRPCASEGPPARYLRVEITIPSGWEAWASGTVLFPADVGTEDPHGAGFVVGWTDPWAGLHSDPCLPVAHMTPDIQVGQTVDDFVEAVRAHPGFEVSDAIETELGGFRGSSLTLVTPADISGCDNWRPWEPGVFAQGPSNIWDLRIIDVEGYRMVVLANDFATTPAPLRAELRAIVESIRFVP